MTAIRRGKVARLAAMVAAVILLNCGSADESGMASPSGGEYPGAGGAAGSTAADASAADSMLPEKEVESSYRSPVATGQYVWIANPTSGRVAYVNASTLEVQTVNAGNGPTYMAAVPAQADDIALTINVLSSDASILRKKAGASLAARNVAIHAGANSWAVSPKGRWAIAWGDYRQAEHVDALQGFQDLTAIDLAEGAEKTSRISVGFRPVAVSFSADETHAFAVTQDGISVIDLAAEGGATSTRIVAISDNPLDDTGSRDVSITPDGSYALVRRDGSSAITVAALADGKLTEIELGGNCTDLDLSPDGKHALAVIRDKKQVAILPIPEVVSSPDTFEVADVQNATVGSVSVASEAAVALLYTNAIAEDRITQLSFEATPAQVHTLKLHAPVLAAFMSAHGNAAIVVHQTITGAQGAFSALSLVPELPAKIVTTKAPITAVALMPDGARAIVAERMDKSKTYGAWLVRGATQQVDRYDLSSPPLAVGTLLTAKRAYVAQEHPEGRITFIDLDTGLARTLTGFELAARVVDGSNP